ncbi:retrotransposon protein, putative, Ty1-copia subclass [Cucumis melo var. makuwa]|uniref:Retrotransposon protein, putative, Ty1-copia subclass n=1 Tax=Cucumis melo var. makuwa TaxID=1194695 RepID=A0A5A7U7K7_CUCMM|nr:retrotransposon protein, putative, Ty1-copia subclass [Cucumis melo var. makuwa]TYK03570.1 retrotransposon protein, putative, Ty1-copia subclass [Cucumis melo var. makuwa]
MYNVEDPKDLTEALSSIDANLWQEAINDEIYSLESNRTWHLVDLPLRCKAIGCKWVLRKKLKPDGSVDKYKMDIKTAFLNSDLKEKIYMEQHEDDMLIFGSNLHVINDVKSMLSANFDMKDLEKILKKYNYFESKPACTPYDSSVKLFKYTSDSVNQYEYASIIGSLRYAADCTRPDIAYVVGLLCRFANRPSLENWNAIERVMRYLKKTQNLGLHYNKFPAVLEGYNDADWNSLSDDSKATSGYIFNIAGGAVA